MLCGAYPPCVRTALLCPSIVGLLGWDQFFIGLEAVVKFARVVAALGVSPPFRKALIAPAVVLESV